MMIVARERRGEGIGKALMLRAFDWCREHGVRLIGLDATPEGEPLSRALGFTVFESVERLEGWGFATSTPERCLVDPAVHADIRRFDAQAFYRPRCAMIQRLIAAAVVQPAIGYGADGRVNGFALARAGARASYIGPVDAVNGAVAEDLVSALLDRLCGPVYIDVFAGASGIAAALAAKGFHKQRGLTRMFVGEHPPRAPLLFASAGPETG